MSQASLDRAIAAIDRGDYRTASQHLKHLYRRTPDDPWVRFYIGRVYEETQRPEAAEKAYRQLLQGSASPKIIHRARQGLQRLEAAEKARRQQAIDAAKADPSHREPGVLILEATPSDRRQEFAQQLARIFDVDAYSARLMLQARGWRLYRTGSVGEMQVYERELREAEIPAFSAKLSDIETINVLRVEYFQTLKPHPVVVCRDRQNRRGKLTFQWSEVRQQVRGGIPIFISAVSYDISRRTEEQVKRKQETQDFAQMCDLHLPQRRAILRLCDRSYDFQQGVIFTPEQQQKLGKLRSATTRINWNGVMKLFDRTLENSLIQTDFLQFAETAIDFHFLMESIEPYVDIDRPEPNNWDPAFQLYSTLAFLREFQ